MHAERYPNASYEKKKTKRHWQRFASLKSLRAFTFVVHFRHSFVRDERNPGNFRFPFAVRLLSKQSGGAGERSGGTRDERLSEARQGMVGAFLH